MFALAFECLFYRLLCREQRWISSKVTIGNQLEEAGNYELSGTQRSLLASCNRGEQTGSARRKGCCSETRTVAAVTTTAFSQRGVPLRERVCVTLKFSFVTSLFKIAILTTSDLQSVWWIQNFEKLPCSRPNPPPNLSVDSFLPLVCFTSWTRLFLLHQSFIETLIIVKITVKFFLLQGFCKAGGEDLAVWKKIKFVFADVFGRYVWKNWSNKIGIVLKVY